MRVRYAGSVADPVIMCQNERWKSVSRILFQLGIILGSAAFIEMYRRDSVTLETVGWLVGAAGLIYAGWKVLMFLETES
jgi:hypothetical protein